MHRGVLCDLISKGNVALQFFNRIAVCAICTDLHICGHVRTVDGKCRKLRAGLRKEADHTGLGCRSGIAVALQCSREIQLRNMFTPTLIGAHLCFICIRRHVGNGVNVLQAIQEVAFFHICAVTAEMSAVMATFYAVVPGNSFHCICGLACLDIPAVVFIQTVFVALDNAQFHTDVVAGCKVAACKGSKSYHRSRMAEMHLIGCDLEQRTAVAPQGADVAQNTDGYLVELVRQLNTEAHCRIHFCLPLGIHHSAQAHAVMLALHFNGCFAGGIKQIKNTYRLVHCQFLNFQLYPQLIRFHRRIQRIYQFSVSALDGLQQCSVQIQTLQRNLIIVIGLVKHADLGGLTGDHLTDDLYKVLSVCRFTVDDGFYRQFYSLFHGGKGYRRILRCQQHHIFAHRTAKVRILPGGNLFTVDQQVDAAAIVSDTLAVFFNDHIPNAHLHRVCSGIREGLDHLVIIGAVGNVSGIPLGSEPDLPAGTGFIPEVVLLLFCQRQPHLGGIAGKIHFYPNCRIGRIECFAQQNGLTAGNGICRKTGQIVVIINRGVQLPQCNALAGQGDQFAVHRILRVEHIELLTHFSVQVGIFIGKNFLPVNLQEDFAAIQPLIHTVHIFVQIHSADLYDMFGFCKFIVTGDLPIGLTVGQVHLTVFRAEPDLPACAIPHALCLGEAEIKLGGIRIDRNNGAKSNICALLGIANQLHTGLDGKFRKTQLQLGNILNNVVLFTQIPQICTIFPVACSVIDKALFLEGDCVIAIAEDTVNRDHVSLLRRVAELCQGHIVQVFQPLAYGQAGQLTVDIHATGSCTKVHISCMFIVRQLIGRSYTKVQALCAIPCHISAVIGHLYRFRRLGNGHRSSLADGQALCVEGQIVFNCICTDVRALLQGHRIVSGTGDSGCCVKNQQYRACIPYSVYISPFPVYVHTVQRLPGNHQLPCHIAIQPYHITGKVVFRNVLPQAFLEAELHRCCRRGCAHCSIGISIKYKVFFQGIRTKLRAGRNGHLVLCLIGCQCKGEAAVGHAQLAVNLEPYLCGSIVHRRLDAADGGQLKVCNVRI